MNKNEIKEANRKALPKFLLVMVVAVIIGGVVGYLSGRYSLNEMAGSVKAAGAFFGRNVAPWLMLAVAVIVLIVTIPMYKKAKKSVDSWDGENEDVSDEVDEKISIVMWILATAVIISYFLIAAAYSGGFESFETMHGVTNLSVAIIAFFGILIEGILLQQKCVDTTKMMNPEKKASVYDMKFQKKWLDSCDEAEKIMIGKCAFRAYSVTNNVCAVLAIILAICALVLDTGFLSSFVVCLIWIVNQSVYCKEAIKYSKGGKIR